MAAQVGPAVEVRGVDFSYGGLRALDGLSLTVPRGVSFGLLGPNGAGKTTLIRMLVGLLRPWRGTVRILGEPSSPRTAASIGYMPQLPALYAELSVFHNVDFFARMYSLGNERPQRVEEVLWLVGLWERRRDSVLHLSGGMRQRLSLACALVHQPPLLLLDEPTVGLDPELRATFWEHFRELTSAGTAIIISSHTMDDAAHCGELAFLRVGRVIAQGTPAQLRAATGREGATLEDAFLYFVRQG